MPSFIYGTAWKEDATETCVRAALAAGFRAIDTANQRKHYFEEGVGRAIAGMPRDQLWLQTKFTFVDGQDQRLPYDPRASIAEQVAQSFRSSLEHLGVATIDSLILHGPSQRDGLGRDDHEAWRAIEALGVASIGISNVTARQVAELVAFARVAPKYVQNRCYADRGWDREVRAVCAQHGIIYQGFSLLTANRHVLADAGVRKIAAARGKTPAQIIFSFARQVGMVPLTGTKDPAHMREDLEVIELEPNELDVISAPRSRAGA